MEAAGAPEDSDPIPLQLDIGYVDVPRDACFSWLQRKYANIKPVVETPSAGLKGKQLRIDSALLQRLENDVVACDELRWRAFSFPSHPIHPLNTSYRHDPGRHAGTPATTIEMRRTKRHSSNSAEHPTNGAKGSHTLVISTRADSEAKRRAQKGTRKAKDSSAAAIVATSGVHTPKVEDLLENAVRKAKQAYWCRVLGEENVDHETPSTSAGADQSIPRSWRPLLGGYVSAPSRIDQARFLIFPQSGHPVVDTRDPKAFSGAPGKLLESPQSVPYYVRGSASWEVEERNPAAGAAESAHATCAEPSDESATRGGLHHSLTYARINPATAPEQRNWADTVEVSVAHQQARTERQYAPERAKVQRVTLLEDSVAVKTSQGNPRHSTLVSATRATVLHSGMKHQCAVSASPSISKKYSKKVKASTAPDDALFQLRIADVYDSSVQHFALPGIWQRWVRPAASRAFTSESDGATGSHSLDDAPRGLYRMCWSAGPGVELCQKGRCTDAAESAKSASAQSSVLTIFGKLCSESWVQVPLSSRWTLTLRNQSAAVVPLEASAVVAPPMVATKGTGLESADTTPSSVEARGSWMKRVCTHPYFWATQGPRWDAALVRGFKNDYNGLHHARRWYSLVSAELTLNGGVQTGNSARVKRSRGAAAPPPKENDSTEGTRENGTDLDGGNAEGSTPTAGSRWRGTSLTAFANACMVDSVRDYPRASVGFSFVSQIPRLAITPFNEIVPRKFECSLSWFAAFQPRAGEAASGKGVNGSARFGLELQSGFSKAGSSTAKPATAADGMPFLRVSPVETFQHMRCGLTWRFDD
ncbi:conserved hypothetical protein [Leishmania major strain Friedlin]|uniref:Uncharacterized protein n=1 Tax=Leishmania major TaxID=5664 RepID=Q4Q6K1_LEIMA|nr:conserved hypothetical protein [Leishmania major strain Friedlin]CAG9579216.1 hypothetical_protein_-_conserved [Leishmania major strain Friedlin]CAJ08249.1 conserved hypothetical protein [Leishmania major strain Friedlin]|eukprot:XP_001685047.1 conserved hypothetical protein [Leishmania major strain Friedlin]